MSKIVLWIVQIKLTDFLTQNILYNLSFFFIISFLFLITETWKFAYLDTDMCFAIVKVNEKLKKRKLKVLWWFIF